MNLSKNVKVTRVMNGVAAGTTDQNSSIIDMSGWDGVLFLAAFGVITATAVTSIKVQQDTDPAGGTMADLAGTAVTVADDDDNQVAGVDVYRPRERYVRLVIDRGTANAVIDGVVAIQYRGSKAPSVHDATTVVAIETHASPAEGTA